MSDYKQPADESDAANVGVTVVAFVLVTVAMWIADHTTVPGDKRRSMTGEISLNAAADHSTDGN